MMVYNTRHYCIVRCCKKVENTTFRKLGLYPTSGEGGETPTLSGHLKRANLNHWTFCSLVFGIPDEGQSPKSR
jgi:hypothetical protein